AARTPETTSLAERRQVTVLFSDVVNFTMQSDKQDAEDVRDRMDALWARLDPIVAQHGGLVTQHSGDGVMALFGAGQARESAPRQAVRAALAMQAALVDFRPGGLPVQMRTGIHTGPVVLGTVGTTGQLTALGDPVNLASRLEGEAPVGGVLISHDTYRQVYGFFDVQAVPAFTVKGKAERVKAYLVLRAKPRPLALRLHGVEGVETQMVGRAEELQRLQRAFEEVLANGKARFLTVVGEAGIGKSRLVHEFQQWAELRPETVRLFAGRATEEGTQVPFALLRDLLSVRFEIQETDPPAVAREKLERGLVSFLGGDGAGGTDAPAQAHFIGHMLGLDFSASPYLQGVLQDAEQIRQRAFFYLTGLFQAVARGVRLPGEAALSQAALVVLEDVHWADNASLDFIAHLMRTCADVPLLVLCLARSTLFERRPRWAEGLPQHERMDLKALSPGQRLTLVESILHKAREVPEPLRDLLVGVTEGNPYFIEEMVKMLVDQKVIIPSAEEWRIEPARLAAAAIPPTLTGVLQARADSLPETERAVLQRASVIGRNFWDTTLERLSAPEAKQDGLSAEQIHRALHALQRKEIIFPRQTSAFSGATEYFFKHELMRKVVYGNVMRRQRRVFHAQTALWLIAESGERVTEFAGLVAGHFEHADLPLDAAEWYGKAGQQANVGYAPASAIHSFQKALALLAAAASAPASAAAQRMEWQEGIGEALSAQARFGEAEAAYRAMRDEAEAARDALAQARAWNGLAFLHERSGDNRASLAAAERAEALARGLGEEAAARTERIRALHLKGWAFYRLGDARMVLALADETLELCTRFEDRRGQARSLKLHGVGHLQLGHYAEADRAFAQGLKLCRELGDWRNAAAMLSNLGESARLRGDCQAAAPLYREALALAREIEHRESEMIYLTNLGGALVGLEQFAQAEAGLRKVIELTSLPNSCGLSETYSLLAEACLGQQQTDDALAAAQQALALAKASGSNLDEGGAWRTLGRVIAALPRGRRARAAQKGAPTPRTCFQRSLSVFRQMKAEGEQARTLRAWAQYELQQRRADDSRKMWAEARTLFQRLGLEAEVQKMDALMPGRRQASRARAREPVRARRLPRRPPKARTAKPHRG
ncbi:MAG TPA: adenylate/guanylate cyclase domain-containing protein, partial [Candidatus Acidoferrum sp.]|nr:adenylate/guanylate cyclase domain-containing protein [Candidatus Acidoferrum sp.]